MVFLFFILFFLLPQPLHAKDFQEYDTAIMRSLNKITAKTSTFEAPINAILSFGTIFLEVKTCQKTPPSDIPETQAFIQIWEQESSTPSEEENSAWLFSGWMFTNAPALSALDHPIYDIWLLDCRNTVKEK